jgi:hypothetical protein
LEPDLALAFSIQAGPGRFALLLGSGVSRSTGIPTGWEIVLDLIERLAVASGESSGPDSVSWYQAEFGHAPRYDDLLGSLAPSPVERAALLRSYFEPTPEERELGVKTPSVAHRAIADLVAGGFLRVIVTTNFDTLTEQALRGVGVNPHVIDNPDSIKGCAPLTSPDVFVVKVHGDYMDARIKNAPEELAVYDPEMDAFLDDIFKNFGLVICGWSAEWDVALREALRRNAGQGRPVYWSSRSAPTCESEALIEQLAALMIRISDADRFFSDLRDRVFALRDFAGSKSLSAAASIAVLKRYLPEPKDRIRLRDLMLQSVQDLVGKCIRERFPVNLALSSEEVASRMAIYEELSLTLAGMVANVSFYGESSHDTLLVEVIEQVSNAVGEYSGDAMLLALERYPALLSVYASGIAAVAAGEYGTLFSILTKPRVWSFDKELRSVQMFNARWMSEDQIKWDFLPGLEKYFTPFSDYLVPVFA